MNGGTSLDVANQAIKEEVWFLHKSGLNKVKKGLNSLEELSRVI
jgi:type II secretory ATPase GspE/PulE/Tfp pilus assembly ATPase PilB-like protein